MPWPTEQKQRTRERIIESAVKLFSAQGFDNVAITDVMKDAQLTNGAFYAHFKSKQELYRKAITSAIKNSALAQDQEVDVSKLLADYLDINHVQQKTAPCPLAFLATDVATREKEVQIAYTDVYNNFINILNKQLSHSLSRKRQNYVLSALMIGGVAISRALSDEKIVLELLDACKEYGDELLVESNS